MYSLEQDVKKLKADLQASRQLEQELRSQISSLNNAERNTRSELGQLRHENELLQNKWEFNKHFLTYCEGGKEPTLFIQIVIRNSSFWIDIQTCEYYKKCFYIWMREMLRSL